MRLFENDHMIIMRFSLIFFALKSKGIQTFHSKNIGS